MSVVTRGILFFMLPFRESSYEVTTILYPAVARQAIHPAAMITAAAHTKRARGTLACSPAVRRRGRGSVLEKQPIVDWRAAPALTDPSSTTARTSTEGSPYLNSRDAP